MQKMMLIFMFGFILAGCAMIRQLSGFLLRERKIGNPEAGYQVVIDPRNAQQVRVRF